MSSTTWWKEPSELIEEQCDILELPLDKNLLLNGPPGSGKTNLLLLRANHLVLSGKPNLYIVVFGSVLKKFIRQGGAQYKFSSDKIITHTALFHQILKENGARLNTSDLDFMEGRKRLSNAVMDLVKNGTIGQIYDALLIDEAQDYFADEINIFRSISKTLIAAADIRQSIYDVEDSSQALRDCVDCIYELKHHYRNGFSICRLADGVMVGKPSHTPLVNYSSYDEKSYPSRVYEGKGLSISQQTEKIIEQLTDQRIAYPNELIGILCPRNEEVGIIATLLQKSSFADQFTLCNDQSFDESKAIWLSTISSAKGLEFRVAHLAGLDYLQQMGPVQRRVTFTAVTRAKTSLSLYCENKIPGYLDSALKEVNPVSAEVTKLQIFGKE